MKRNTYFEDEITASARLNLLLKYKSRCFQLIITDDNDESYIPNFDEEYILCDCNNGEDFTRGRTWKKYFEDFNNKPVLFINTSNMFKQFQKASTQLEGIDENGAAIWAQYIYYNYRDKMWREQRTKFLFVIKETDYVEMMQYVDAGFGVELVPIYIKKQNNIEKEETIIQKQNESHLVKIKNIKNR